MRCSPIFLIVLMCQVAYSVQVEDEESGSGDAETKIQPTVPVSGEANGHAYECAYRADDDCGRVKGE